MLDRFVSASLKESERKYLYKIVRRYKPIIVLETGSGASTLCVLSGLKKNKQGQLFSIDLPNLEGERRQGPEHDSVQKLWQEILSLYPNWKIYEEDIYTALPRVVKDLSHVSLFLHDSKHTSEHVAYEFDIVLPKLLIGSVFGMHDIHSKEMIQFVAEMNLRTDFCFVGKKRQLGFWQRIK